MPSTIKLGDTGDDVKRLQRVFARMKVLGPDTVDGVFGAQTEQAVKDFQQSNGLVVDGVVGPITWSHIHPYREASPTLSSCHLHSPRRPQPPTSAGQRRHLRLGCNFAATS